MLWPEFQEINAALVEYLSEVTETIIREEVFGDTRDAEVARESGMIEHGRCDR